MLYSDVQLRALEKEMATHSSVLAWRIPGTGEPGGLPSMGFQYFGHLMRRADSLEKTLMLGGIRGRRRRGRPGPSSSCVWNPRVFADDALGWQCNWLTVANEAADSR